MQSATDAIITTDSQGLISSWNRGGVLIFGYRKERSVHGDPGRLRQILMNLVGNAVKFTAHGGVELLVSEVQMGSNGHPICSPRLRSWNFPLGSSTLVQPFSQGDASIARRHGGTGLGLTISRRLVALMQGEMGVDSEEGQGSTFWCLIPLKPATGSVPTHVTLHTPARPSRRRPVQPLVGSSPRTRILLAEDNAINQQLVVRLLERVGYRVDVAANGQEALESHQRAPCDAILMDCQIPEMSGLTATVEIRRREGITTHTPIIALTADCRQEDRDRCIGIGMDDLIPKPLDRDVLYETLGRVLGASTAPECPKPDVH